MKKLLLAVLALPLIFSIALFSMTIFSPPAFASPAFQDNPSTAALSQKSFGRIVKEVRHELVMLPYYGVFDNLSYKVDPDGTVTLIGQVAKPVLKSDAENAVKRIEGVEKVVNNIEVLPLSPSDDRDPPRRIPRDLQQQRPQPVPDARRSAHSHHRQERKHHPRRRGCPRDG